MSVKRLVINADDFGYCPSRNQAIIDLYNSGAITSASFIVNSQSSLEAGKSIQSAQLPFGLHFNITEGRPTSSSSVQSLCNDEGFFLGKFGFRKRLQEDRISLNEAGIELQSQIDKFIELCGRRPTHVDGHMHVHVLPGLCDIFAQVLSKNNIKWTRVPKEENLEKLFDNGRRCFYMSVVRQAVLAETTFTKAGLRFAPWFIGNATMGHRMSTSGFMDLLQDHVTKSTDGNLLCEWMVHPAYKASYGSLVFGEGPDEFARSSDRQHELNILTSDDLSIALKSSNVQLCSFNDLENFGSDRKN